MLERVSASMEPLVNSHEAELTRSLSFISPLSMAWRGEERVDRVTSAWGERAL